MAAGADLIRTPHASGRGGKRIPCLDGLRAISVLLVIFAHGQDTVSSNIHVPGWLLPHITNAGLGVTTFFVISGYLITHLLKEGWRRTGTVGLKDFYHRRVLRIFPAFYLYLGAISVLTLLGNLAVSPNYIASAALFVQNYRELGVDRADLLAHGYWFVGHFWTLALEEQFYLFWPLLFLLLGPRRAAFAAAGLVVLAPVSRVATYFLVPSIRGQLDMMFPMSADPLMIGCLAALWQGEPPFERILRPFLKGPVVAAAALFVLIVSVRLKLAFQGSYSLTLGMTLNSASIVLILLWLTRNSTTAVVAVFNSRIAVHIGVLSYSLYLWQQLFMTTENTTWSGAFPANLLATYLAALISYRCVELPFLALRNRGRAPAGSIAADQNLAVTIAPESAS